MARKMIHTGSGKKVPFSRKRIVDSLMRTGIAKKEAIKISGEVGFRVEPGMTTKDVYEMAFSILRRHENPGMAGRYSLKQSIMEMGPTGYPFEQFVARILKENGYKVKTGQTLMGACVSHEIDVIAEKDGEKNYVECKFHNHRGYRTDVKVPLYIYSRFLDVKEDLVSNGDKCECHQQWIVTNTKFSGDAILYGECKGIKMIGWRYPENGGLEKLIEDHGLHPVTCITNLTPRDKKSLLDQGLLLCKELHDHSDKLFSLGLGKSKVQKILNEAKALCERKS